MLGSVKGAYGGAVRAMHLHPTDELLATASLDRWARMHDCASRRLLSKVFMKAQLNACCWVEPAAATAAASPSEEAAHALLAARASKRVRVH